MKYEYERGRKEMEHSRFSFSALFRFFSRFLLLMDLHNHSCIS